MEEVAKMRDILWGYSDSMGLREWCLRFGLGVRLYRIYCVDHEHFLVIHCTEKVYIAHKVCIGHRLMRIPKFDDACTRRSESGGWALLLARKALLSGGPR